MIALSGETVEFPERAATKMENRLKQAG